MAKKELSPTSDVDKALVMGDEYVSQVRAFGALGYSAERICSLLGLQGKRKAALLIRLALPGDVYHEEYNRGISLGEYNMDAELAKQAEAGDIDAVKALEDRKLSRDVRDERKRLFGV